MYALAKRLNEKQYKRTFPLPTVQTHNGSAKGPWLSEPDDALQAAVHRPTFSVAWTHPIKDIRQKYIQKIQRTL